MGDNVEIILTGEVVKIEESNNQDGTIDVTYIVKCEEIQNVNGEEVC
jgi:hypothetical protein